MRKVTQFAATAALLAIASFGLDRLATMPGLAQQDTRILAAPPGVSVAPISSGQDEAS